jgi:adenylosuccinate lyase
MRNLERTAPPPALAARVSGAGGRRKRTVTPEQVADLKAHQDEIDLERAFAYEAEIRHDVMSEIRAYADQCAIGGGIIHLGATSTDVLDNADALRQREALTLIKSRLRALIEALADQIETWADTPVMAFTHIQPAEPTTLGTDRRLRRTL